MKPQEQITAFEAHAKALHKEFDRGKSVLEPLFNLLDATKDKTPVVKLKKEEVAALLSNEKKDPKKDPKKETNGTAGDVHLRHHRDEPRSGGPPTPTSGRAPGRSTSRPSRRT